MKSGNKCRKLIIFLNRATKRIFGESLNSVRSLHFDWRTVEKFTLVTLLKLMVSYIAITAIATQSIDFIEHWGLNEVQLPFKWQVLFWGSFFYCIGYVIYIWRCPPFIREHPDFRTVRSSSIIIDDYIDQLEWMEIHGIELLGFEQEQDEIIACLKEKKPINNYENDCLAAINQYAVNSGGANRGDIEKSKELYNIIMHSLSEANIPSAITSAIFIYLSFFALFYVVLCNVIIAVRYLLT